MIKLRPIFTCLFFFAFCVVSSAEERHCPHQSDYGDPPKQGPVEPRLPTPPGFEEDEVRGIFSRVVIATDPAAHDGSAGRDDVHLNADVVRNMVNNAVIAFTGADTLVQAWTELIPDPSKKVAIKINCQIEGIFTKAKVVMPITEGLIARGVPADNIIIYDKTSTAFGYAGFTRNPGGPGVRTGVLGEGDFGSYSNHSEMYYIANLLVDESGGFDCDYLINVPVCKALDGYSGVTLSMKNHYGTCSPRHEDIHNEICLTNALAPIKDKTVLIVMDACYCEYNWVNGRDQTYVDVVNKIIVSNDPVAIDYHGWQIIEQLRADHGMGPCDPYPAFIDLAADTYGLGTNNPEQMEIIDLVAAPVASFSADPRDGARPLTVQFTDRSTGLIDSWQWNFGDGGTSAERHPAHTFDLAGRYDVSLTVTGPSGSDQESADGFIVVLQPLLVAGPGPGPDNPPQVRLFDTEDTDIPTVEFTAYGVPRYGVNVAVADIDGQAGDEILTGPGPGAIFGPHVRAFNGDGTLHAGGAVSFIAYGTTKYGVNVTAGDIDGDGIAEIITGPGPGVVFGPHVRGFDYDGDEVSPIQPVSFFAYGTLKYGCNVATGDVDGDGIDEIITGAGPGTVFGPHVRAFDYDGGEISPIPGISFFAYGTLQYGCNVTSADLDGDGVDEIVTGPGPGVMFGSHIRGWRYDGSTTRPMPEVSFIAHGTGLYGAQVTGCDIDQDGIDEILTSPGPGPTNGCQVRGWNCDDGVVTLIPGIDFYAFDPAQFSYGGRVSYGAFSVDQ